MIRAPRYRGRVATGWQPANETERALARAVAAGDRAGFFRILGSAELYLPQLSNQSGGERQALLTTELFGHTMLPVYTSPAGVATVAGAYTVTSCAELRQKWPRPEWRLAVNPGLPIDAYLPVEAVAAAGRGEVDVVTAAEAVVDGIAADPTGGPPDPAESLRDAARRGDADEYAGHLLDSTVVVLTAGEVEAPESVLQESGIPWRVSGDPPTIEVFTSQELFDVAYPDPPPSVMMPFTLLLSRWPDGHALAVDPGTGQAVTLPPGDVLLLLLWTVDREDGERGDGPDSGAAGGGAGTLPSTPEAT